MIELTGKRVLVKEHKKEQKKLGGIIIPNEISSTNIMLGDVVSTGNESTFKSEGVVFFIKNDAIPFDYESENYFILNDDNILGRIKN